MQIGPHPELPGRRAAPGVAELLRRRNEAILHSWEARVTSELPVVKLEALALRDDIPELLDELAEWLRGDTPPEGSLLATAALVHVTQRLDAGLSLGQLLREYRLLRETIIEELLGAETEEQAHVGAAGEGARHARIPELARLNAGLDLVLSRSIEQFVEERDHRATVERARAAEAMRESETRYRALFDSIDQGFCIVEVLFDEERPVDYRFLELNRAFERNTGLGDARGKRIRELVPRHEQHWFDTYGRIAQTGTAERFESEARAMGRFYEVFAFRVGEPEQRRVAVLFKDVTPRKRTEDALKASEELKAYLLELSDALRPLSDATEIHATVTRTARQHFAADRCYYCELEGGVAIVRRDDSRAGLGSMVGEYSLGDSPRFSAALSAGRPFVVEDARTTELLDENLRALCLRLEIVSLLNVPVIKQGAPVGLLCITQSAARRWTESELVLAGETAERAWAAVAHAHTLTALRLANERLVEADRRKDEFLGVLSHELRNPLTPIRNSVYLLERTATGGEQEQVERARQVIERQTRHLALLIEDLLDVTRISRGKIVLRRALVDLNEIAKGTAEDHRELFANWGVELELVEAGEPVWVEGDRTRLVQVIGNLLTNSAKFTPRGGRTVITVGQADGRAVLRVRDTGVGMSAETLTHVFKPFVQAEQTLERARGGLGLGLSLVKGLMELHDGTVTAHSEGEGRGAEFVVTLPVEVGPSAAAGARSGPRPGAKPRRVLVVEDNVDTADSLRDLLALEGHEVSVAYSGPEGLEAARAKKPDLIICDLGLPGLDGYEVARAIRADPDAKVSGASLVALSGYALPEDVSRSRDAGFNRHLAKPPSDQALAELFGQPRRRRGA